MKSLIPSSGLSVSSSSGCTNAQRALGASAVVGAAGASTMAVAVVGSMRIWAALSPAEVGLHLLGLAGGAVVAGWGCDLLYHELAKPSVLWCLWRADRGWEFLQKLTEEHREHIRRARPNQIRDEGDAPYQRDPLTTKVPRLQIPRDKKQEYVYYSGSHLRISETLLKGLSGRDGAAIRKDYARFKNRYDTIGMLRLGTVTGVLLGLPYSWARVTTSVPRPHILTMLLVTAAVVALTAIFAAKVCRSARRKAWFAMCELGEDVKEWLLRHPSGMGKVFMIEARPRRRHEKRPRRPAEPEQLPGTSNEQLHTVANQPPQHQ